MKKNILFTLAAAGLLLVSCGGNSSSPAASSVAPAGSSATPATSSTTPAGDSSSQATIGTITVELDGVTDNKVFIGTENGATAIAKIDGVESNAVTWSSSDTAVATVDSSGFVVGVAKGTADIIATSTVDTTKTGKITITVDAKPVVLTAMKDVTDGKECSVRGEITAVTKGGVYIDDGTGVVQLYYKNGSPSADYTVGRVVTATGTIKMNSYSYGEAELEMEGASAATIVFEEGITIQKTTMDEPASITADELEALKANPFRAKAVTFKATAVKSGKYVNWKLGDILLSYKSKPDSMPSLVEGVEYTVKGYLLSYNSSSNYFPVAAVSVDGKTDPVTSLELDATELSIPVGQNKTVKATVAPATAIGNVFWSSEDETIATVKGGVVTAVKEGTTNIVATTEGLGADGKAIVKKVAVTVTPEEKVVLPIDGDFSASTSSGGAVLPYGWTSGSTYAYAGGLKFSSTDPKYNWVASPVFEATDKGVEAVLDIKAFNASQKDGTYADDTEVFSIVALNGEGTAVDTESLTMKTVVGKGQYKVTLEGTGIAQVKFSMTNFPVKDGKNQNVNVQAFNLKEVGSGPVLTALTMSDKTLDLNIGAEKTLSVTATPAEADATVTWASSDPTVATVAANGLVAALAAGTTTITATSTVNSEITAECVVTVSAEAVNYGTEAAPLSVAAGNAIIDALDDGGSTPAKMTVKGIVTRFVSATAFWIKDETTDAEVEVYFFDVADGVAAPAVNDTIVVKGDGKKYVNNNNVTLEITGPKGDNAKILSNVRGTSAVTLGAHEHATVTGLPEGGTAVNGSKVEFTVTPESGFVIDLVKVNGKSVNAEEGKYSFIVDGPMEVVVTTKSASDTSVTLSKSFDDLVAEHEQDWTIASGSADHKDKVVTPFKLGGLFTVTTTGTGNTGTVWSDKGTYELRIYGTANKSDASMTITADDGYKIKTVKVAFLNSNSPTVKVGEDAVDSEELVTVNGTSVTYTMLSGSKNGQIKIRSFEIVYEAVANN
ncbi:MAG: Ig-like domain-containing protein [Bacilli bacterium]|nr:Ig-like domain-containing protein [Bacilli bacterium]